MKAYSFASVTIHAVFIPCECDEKQREVERVLYSNFSGIEFRITGLGFTLENISQQRLDKLRDLLYNL